MCYLVLWQIPLVDATLPESRHRVRRGLYGPRAELWQVIDLESRDAGKTLAYVGEHYTFPLYGSRLQNRVCYQSVNSVDPMPVHRYPPGRIAFPCSPDTLEALYRSAPDFDVWWQGLVAQEVDWLVVENQPRYVEREWIAAHPERFVQLFDNDFGSVYGVRPEAAQDLSKKGARP
jgi:hypothetical protein